MRLKRFARHGPIAWMALFAILLVALAPTVSQVAASLRHDGGHGHAHATAMSEDAHAGHASHAMPASSAEHAGHTDPADSPATVRDAPPEDCWSACGYCDLFGHVPALELPACAALVDAELPAPAIKVARVIHTDIAQRRPAQPRGPPLPFA